MKARVIETNENAENEIEELQEGINNNYFTKDGVLFKGFELDFNVEQIDYWDKLKHQYAGMAMQGILANPKFYKGETSISIAIKATTIASTLIDKLKEEEK